VTSRNGAEALADAAADYRDARQRESGDRPEIALKQHGALRAAGAHAAAAQVLTEWLARYPEAAWAQAALAEHAMAQQQCAVARTRLETSLKRAPRNPEAGSNHVHVLLQLADFEAARAG
jgi:Flp pilus assembly protein TadD